MVFERGSITGTSGRGLDPKEALLDTCGGPALGEPTGPLELKRLLPAGDSPCGPALDNFRGLAARLLLRGCPAVPGLEDVPSLGELSPVTLCFRIDEDVGFE